MACGQNHGFVDALFIKHPVDVRGAEDFRRQADDDFFALAEFAVVLPHKSEVFVRGHSHHQGAFRARRTVGVVERCCVHPSVGHCNVVDDDVLALGFKAFWARPQDIFGICAHGDGQPFARFDVSTEDRRRQRLVDHNLQRIVLNFTLPSEPLHHVDASRVRVGDAHVHFQSCRREVVGTSPLVQPIFNRADGKFKRVAQAWVQLLVGRFVLQRTVVREVSEPCSGRGPAIDDAQMERGGGVLDAGGFTNGNLTFQRGHLGKHPVGVAGNDGEVGGVDHASVAVEEEITLSAVGHQNVQAHGLAGGTHKDGRRGPRALYAGQLSPAKFTSESSRLPYGDRCRGLDERRGCVQGVAVRLPGLQGCDGCTVDCD